MAFDFSKAGRCLQVVWNQSFLRQSPTGQSTYTYVEIANTTKSFTIKETGSLIIVESYTQGYMGGSTSGNNCTIRWNDNILGRGSSSNGDGWTRSGNGGDATRSWSNGRIHCIDHGLTAGSTITITLMHGAWSTTGATVNYSDGYASPMCWVASEYSRS